MKKGLKKLLAIVFSLVAVVSASVLFGLHNINTEYISYAAETREGEDYSTIDGNNIILSAEKVEIAPTGDILQGGTNRVLTDDNEFKDTPNGFEKSIAVNGGSYNFNNIQNGNNQKYVIKNDEFVMLNNKLVGNNYAKLNTETNAVDTDVAEGVLITFGGYIYKENGEISTNGTDSWAGISMLNVTATLNGDTEHPLALPGVRFETDNNYNDFAVIIPQISGWEGYYKFDFEYYVNEQKYTQTFGFYIIYNSSYNNAFISGTNTYYSYPTMEIGDTTYTESAEYQLGITGDNYPTITYDYTKYDLTYTLTTKGVVEDYSIIHSTSENMGVTSHYLTLNKSVKGNPTSYDPILMQNNKNNLVTVMLTEMGNYKFTFKMVYKGYGDDRQPDNLKTIEKTLDINGMQLYYAVTEEIQAQLKYLILSANSNDEVGLIVPNGYLRGQQPKDSKNYGVVYSLDNSSEEKVGTVLSNLKTDETTKNQDANISTKIGKDNINTFVQTLIETDPSKVLSNNTSISKLNKIGYIKTNQGPLWLDSNNEYDANNSFYFYGILPLTEYDLYKYTTGEDGTKPFDTDTNGNYISAQKPYNNKVTFNNVGYYLVVIDVDDSDSTNYQIFAFQYASDTINVSVVDQKGTPDTTDDIVIGSGQYTNKEITVSWVEPDVFERKITAYYYKSLNTYRTLEQLEQTERLTLTNGQKFSVDDGDFACFLVELRGEDKTKAQRTFVIDKSHIQDINLYRADKIISSLGYTYEFQTDVNGYYMPVQAITDDFATLFWRDKASKANVTAKYYIIPFVENSDEIKSVSSSLTEEYVLTNYSLGSPIGPISFDKAISQTNQLGESQIFTRQGIYYFTLTDDAGNSVNYVFVIDKTEMFFKVTQGSEQAKVSKYVSNDYILSQNDVKVEIGTHKAIDLSYNLQDNADKSMVTSVITGLFSGGLEGYYAEQNTNKIALQNLLSNFNGTYYLTVKQKNLLICDENGTAISAGEITAPTTKTVKLNSTDSTFVWNNFFVLGENQTEIIQNSNSNLMVEINTDQALGMAYYSNDSMTLGAIPNGNLSNDKGNINRLILENDSIQKTHATKDNNLAFVWRLNVGETKVSKITYTYYNLSLDNYTEDYFFQSNSGDTTIFVDGSEDEKLKADDQDEARALKFIDISKDGLYIITRTLANGETLSYKLIIDRTGIIEADKLDNNNLNILINLLENETQFTNFNNPGKNDGKLYYYNNQTEATVNTPYKYFVTNKVPATISIPKSKFIKGENESTYNAGRLNYEMYFVDTQTQLQNDKNKAFKVLEGKVEGGNEDKGNFTINLNDSLNFGDIKNEYLLKLKNSNNLQNWLTLPGDYVVIIKDAVETASNPTQQIVAFRIKQKYPTPQVYASSSETGEQVYATGDSGQYNLTTNKRYININLPKYIGEDATANENLNAQLDQNYLVITKNGTDYLRHEYKHMSGVQLSEVSKDTDGNLIVKLDTFVNGSASFENSTYVITVRYKLSGLDEHNQTINEKYKDCYYYYDQNRKIQYYYETKIVIKLDRIPPETNLNNLISKDTLINTYEQEQNCKMFTDTEIEKPGETYFVKQYTEFYQSKNVKDLFALHLYGDDSFEIGDVKNVYINKIANLENFNWNLPLSQTPISLDSYKNVSNLTYGIVAENLKLEEGSYYEIIEEDMAGNLTQYLVLYCGNVGNEKTTHDDLKIQIPINGVGEDNNKIQIDLSDSATNYNITMFGFDEDENATIVANRGNDYFYHFELSKGGSFVTSFNTNASTSFSKAGIISQIKELFTTAGNYTLKVSSRTKTVSISINYILEKIALSAQDLVQEGETYYINLNGANTTVDGVNYYATEIKLLYTNNNSAVSETYIYTSGEWYKNETKVDSIIKCDKDTTYEVILTDICGNTSRYMFNTNGKKFTDITFGKDDLLESAKIGDTYYSFQQAKITFDQIFNAVEINDEKYTKTANGWQQENNITNLIKTEENGVNYLVLDFEKINNVIQQEKLEFIIKFYVKENDTDEKISYHIVLDNRTAHTTLSEVATDKDQEMNVDYNIDDLLKTEAKSSTSGVMNLSWTDYTSDYFDFEYQLIEWTDIANNLSDEHDISGVNAYTIRTSKDSDGLYRFVITVLDKQTNKVLGNKVYTFRVQAKLNELYYVEKGNIAISPNAYFVKSNITDYIYDNSLKLTDLDITEDDLPTSKIDLYITNEEVVVLPATDLGAGLLSTKAITLSSGTFTLHRIYTHSISQYVGVLQVSESSNLINNIKITTTDSASSISINPNDGLSHVINGQKTDIVKVTFNQIVTGSTDISNLEKKNTIQLKVSYNNKPVGIYDLDSGLLEDENSSYSYTIKGNGQYTFEFLDKAGNTHIFETTYNNTSKLDINVLREVIVSVKENHPEKETEATAPIDNAFYNYPVTISVLQAQNYEFGSISVSATLQGEKYTPDKNQYDYTFEKYGTYKVTITATNEYGQTIKKILNFTIINQNEAINSIDLNVLSGYEITDVIYFSEAQNKKENITDTFKNTLINKNIGNGMSLTYDEVLEMYSTLGKKSFTLKYKVADNIYPTREQEFTFTLNNAVPYIECSLKPGESTTKSFTVTFNPGIIYSQVGDCELFIGGERVAEINIKSNSVPDTITITEKDNGAGDYYITLKSTSGNVITSFKVVVKEPLNAWAIVIIVVVVLVVGTIVTIIILLRTRMRIR